LAGPRVYTVDEVNELIPELERRFLELDELRRKLKISKIRLDALEMIWGDQIHKNDCPDHGEYDHHLEELKATEEQFQKTAGSFSEFSATVKGLDPGLLDFYGVHDGHLVFLCWRRGEEKCEFWHHVDAGFAGRQPV
jgi:hypothetical protein